MMTIEKDNFTRITVLLTLLVVAGGFVTWLLYQTSVIYKREGHTEGAEEWVQQWIKERTARIERAETQIENRFGRVEKQINGLQEELFSVRKRVKLLEERARNE